jgi:hypothetical protein
MSRPACWIAVIVLLSTQLARAQLLSPGPLSASHASLEGDDKCNRCHTSGKGVSDFLCTGCHGNVGATIAAGRGLHGRQFRGQPCAKCHSDHRGRGFALIRWNPASFDHGQTGWPLQGAHAAAKCNACHKSRSYLGLSQACTSCHKDPHANRFGSACTNCHDQSQWKQVSLGKFNHDLARFPLRGAHLKAACNNCHGAPPKYTGLDFDGCVSCHADPHRGRFSERCVNCHKESSWHEIVMAPGAHPGLSLANGHRRVKCGACHDKGYYRQPSRGSRCAGCHAPVHEAAFGDRCESCHASIRWLGLKETVGRAVHDKTAFALRGRHRDVDCDGCHKPELAPAARFRQLSFGRCKDCHADAHQGEFEKRNGGECGPCHTERGFRPASFGILAHRSTAFALDGKHTAVPCARCHAPASSSASTEPALTKKKSKRKKDSGLAHDPAPRGQRLAWNTADSACAGCHQNPHGDQFAEVIRRDGCGGCHVTSGWNTPKIDHKSWPLTGAHASAPCDRCHAPSAEDRKSGRGASYRNAPRQCEGCHSDVHAGQFRLTEPRRACTLCHDTEHFEIGRKFDHARLAGYPLAGKHAGLSCDRCHRVEPLKDGTRARRYRLGYRHCRDCHADPHAGDTG